METELENCPCLRPAQAGQPIPWAKLGVKATAQYSGDGLAVFAAQDGAVRVRCAFQQLDGEVTRQGLWLTSTADGAVGACSRSGSLEEGVFRFSKIKGLRFHARFRPTAGMAHER